MPLWLGMVQINVTDLDEAWRFYVETLEIPGRWNLGPGKPFQLDLGVGPAVLVYRVTQVAPRAYPDATGATIVFHTADIHGTVERWRERRVSFVPISWARTSDGIAPTPFGPFIAFRDPFDNVHELLEPR